MSDERFTVGAEELLLEYRMLVQRIREGLEQICAQQSHAFERTAKDSTKAADEAVYAYAAGQTAAIVDDLLKRIVRLKP